MIADTDGTSDICAVFADEVRVLLSWTYTLEVVM